MKKTHLAHTLALGLSTLALSACGGGGGDDESTKITVLQVGDLVIERPANGGQPALTNSLLPTVLQPADKPNEQQHASLPQSPVLPQQSAGQASPPGGAQNIQSEQNVSTPPVTQPVPTHPEKPVSVNIATGNNGTATGGSSNTPSTGNGSGNTSNATGIAAEDFNNNTSTSTDTPSIGDAGIIGESGLISASGCELQYRLPANGIRVGAGADPRMAEQWHLENNANLKGYISMVRGEDLRVKPVWAQNLKGEGIRIAVLDDGLEVTHEDLAPNVVAGSHNFRKKPRDGVLGILLKEYETVGLEDYPVPCSVEDFHGTAVAGLIAARDGNGVGGAGVAPRASLVGYNILASILSSDTVDALTRGLDKNHIYNNSWGPDDSGLLYPPLYPAHLGYQMFNNALDKGLREGRKGQGVIYVFSGGNGGAHGDYSSLDATVSALGVVTVCASNAAGVRAPYSERGANLTVCAPTGGTNINDEKIAYLPLTVTTALNNGYTDEFAGTSASAPMVSGVIALMLQANAKLTWRDVPLILARTARKIDTAKGGWDEYRSPLGNGNTSYDVLHYSHSYGFGVANAEAAVSLARSWQSVGGSSSLKKCETLSEQVDQIVPEQDVIAARLDTRFPRAMVQGNAQHTFMQTLLKASDTLDYNAAPNRGLTSAITVPDSANCNIQHIEHIDVEVTTTDEQGNAEHEDMGSLQMALVSPMGKVSTLMVPHVCTTEETSKDEFPTLTACTSTANFHFGVRRHLEEPIAQANKRTWKLVVSDRLSGGTVKLKNWKLTFWGR